MHKITPIAFPRPDRSANNLNTFHLPPGQSKYRSRSSAGLGFTSSSHFCTDWDFSGDLSTRLTRSRSRMHYTTDYRNYKEGASYQYRPRYQHSKRYSFDFTNQETSSKHYGTVHMLTG